MKKCSILLSIYNPNEEFLVKQLESLNNQTYKNCEVLIYDDCPNLRYDKTKFKKYLNKINYRVLKYKKNNIGYSKAFEELIKNVAHDGYIAFCDQDDIWFDSKIEEMIKKLETENKAFSYCNRNIINTFDNIIKENECNSLIKDFKGDNYKLLTGSPFRTLAPGMSIICTVSFAKSCLPFYNFAFDKWLSCCALAENTSLHVDKVLVNYRRHGNNVSGILNGIKSKKDYFENRVKIHNDIVVALKEKYPNVDLDEMIYFSNCRMNKNIVGLYKKRWISKKQTILEIILCIIPSFIFDIILKIRK